MQTFFSLFRVSRRNSKPILTWWQWFLISRKANWRIDGWNGYDPVFRQPLCWGNTTNAVLYGHDEKDRIHTLMLADVPVWPLRNGGWCSRGWMEHSSQWIICITSIITSPFQARIWELSLADLWRQSSIKAENTGRVQQWHSFAVCKCKMMVLIVLQLVISVSTKYGIGHAKMRITEQALFTGMLSDLVKCRRFLQNAGGFSHLSLDYCWKYGKIFIL